MKRKVDFTVKGTKLPVIPKWTEYNVENDEDGYTPIDFQMENIVSFGIFSESEIFAEYLGYTGQHKYIFKLSTIEYLAEEQGILWVEDEAIGEPTFSPLLSPDNNNGRGGRFIPHPLTTLQPSIEQLLIDCITLNNTIKTSCRLFESIDDNHKLDLMYDARVKFASKVAELNNILNNN